MQFPGPGKVMENIF
uniref:Uncharacterized protein n=1 Tax=Anguilla anguilla TaxID=7936 RepID=A0A0E9Y0N5_ANGAN